MTAYGVLRQSAYGLESASRGDFSYVITVESVLKTHKSPRDWWVAEPSVLTFSACPNCSAEDALEFAATAGSRRLLLGSRPSLPGLLGIPAALTSLELSFDVVGGSVCADLQIDPSGASAAIEAALGGKIGLN